MKSIKELLNGKDEQVENLESQITAFETQVADLLEQNESLRELQVSHDETIATLETTNSKLTEDLGAAQELTVELEAKLEEATVDRESFEQEVAVEAASQVSELGVAPVEEIEESEEEGDIMEIFSKLSATDKIKFYNAHSEAFNSLS